MPPRTLPTMRGRCSSWVTSLFSRGTGPRCSRPCIKASLWPEPVEIAAAKRMRSTSWACNAVEERDFALADRRFAESQRIMREVGDRRGVALNLWHMGQNKHEEQKK